MYTVFAKDHWFSRADTMNTRCQSWSSNTESPFSEKRQRTSWPTGAGAAHRVAFMPGRSLHVARPRSRRGPVPARRTRQPHSLLSRLHRAQRRAAAASSFPTERRLSRSAMMVTDRFLKTAIQGSSTMTDSTYSTIINS